MNELTIMKQRVEMTVKEAERLNETVHDQSHVN